MAFDKSDIEFVVVKYFGQQFAIKEVHWVPDFQVDPSKEKEAIIDGFVDAFNELTYNFQNGDKYNELLRDLSNYADMFRNIPEESLLTLGYDLFERISNDLLAGGIKWGHILYIFVLAFELANELQDAGKKPTRIRIVADWLMRYTSEKLLQWMNENDRVDMDDF